MAYDPYLDKSLSEEQLNTIRKDEQANVIFARQDYQIKDGLSLGLERERCYLIISATDDFLDKADKKLKASVPGIKRVDPELEKRIVATVEDERHESEQGLGMIFGG
ncbi:MAG: hypothetical protein KGH72_04255 [Candidatus Micrarchaeota archaeon]|nr:hypothetical protein [Candidatus Micrarchaeota archaeon]